MIYTPYESVCVCVYTHTHTHTHTHRHKHTHMQGLYFHRKQYVYCSASNISSLQSKYFNDPSEQDCEATARHVEKDRTELRDGS
jgi:hypothetical protein